MPPLPVSPPPITSPVVSQPAPGSWWRRESPITLLSAAIAFLAACSTAGQLWIAYQARFNTFQLDVLQRQTQAAIRYETSQTNLLDDQGTFVDTSIEAGAVTLQVIKNINEQSKLTDAEIDVFRRNNDDERKLLNGLTTLMHQEELAYHEARLQMLFEFPSKVFAFVVPGDEHVLTSLPRIIELAHARSKTIDAVNSRDKSQVEGTSQDVAAAVANMSQVTGELNLFSRDWEVSIKRLNCIMQRAQATHTPVVDVPAGC